MKKGTIKDFFITLLLIGLTTASICAVVFAIYINRHILPKANMDVSGLTMNLTSVVYYEEDGEYKELERLHGEQNRIWVEFETIPQNLKDAFVAIEDERFYSHSGVDWKRTIGAAINWVVPIRDGFGGGSTITQQLIKNITSDDDFKVTRKITEVLRALNLEKKLKKDEILELYLNTIYLGRNAYGVTTAANTYFGKEVAELNLAESAIIAGITKNPSYYDPFRFPENIKTRQELILTQMEKQGKITEEQKQEAIAYELDYKKAENSQNIESKQSYFVDALVEDVLNDLMEQKGYSKQVASQLLYSGGLQIYATVDKGVQDIMEGVFTNDSKFPNIKGANGDTPQASMVIMDPLTGQVKGLIGGRGEKKGDRVLNRATQTTRSPGSAIKPIAVYAPAIDSGIITPISVYDDTPYDFITNDSGWPKNYYTGYRGRMTVLEAVADSVNTVPVKILSELGTRESFNFMTTNLNVSTLVEANKLSNGKTQTDIALAPLALGGLTNGMSVLELTASYVPFANDGYYIEPITYTQVLDPDGDVILENAPESEKVFKSENTVHYMRQLLTEVVSSGTGTRAKISNMQTLGKTGTTNNDYDRWFVGATPYYVSATWFGYDNQQTVKGVSSNPALALWKDVMDQVHKGLSAKNFTAPKNFVTVSYCRDSGLLPTELCSTDVRGSRVSTARLASSDAPKQTCNIHTSVNIDRTTGGIANEFCPDDSIKAVSLMDLTRLGAKSIFIRDQLYTVTVNNAPIGTGVEALRTSSSSETPTYTGKVCTVHTEHSKPDEPEVPEVGPEEPNIPTIPDVPDENTGDPERN